MFAKDLHVQKPDEEVIRLDTTGDWKAIQSAWLRRLIAEPRFCAGSHRRDRPGTQDYIEHYPQLLEDNPKKIFNHAARAHAEAISFVTKLQVLEPKTPCSRSARHAAAGRFR